MRVSGVVVFSAHLGLLLFARLAFCIKDVAFLSSPHSLFGLESRTDPHLLSLRKWN